MSVPPSTPRPRPPSPSDVARLHDDLRAELDRARMAWLATVLRGDGALDRDDAQETAEAFEDHERLLATLHDELDRLVADATAGRAAAPPVDDTPVPSPVTASRPSRPAWRGAMAGAGIASLVAVMAGLLAGPAMPRPDVAPLAGAATAAQLGEPSSASPSDLASPSVAEVASMADPTPLPGLSEVWDGWAATARPAGGGELADETRPVATDRAATDGPVTAIDPSTGAEAATGEVPTDAPPVVTAGREQTASVPDLGAGAALDPSGETAVEPDGPQDPAPDPVRSLVPDLRSTSELDVSAPVPAPPAPPEPADGDRLRADLPGNEALDELLDGLPG